MLELDELLEKLELTTDPERLDEYADFSNKEVRITVALNLAASKETMFRRLALERDGDILSIWEQQLKHWYRHKKHHIDAKLGDETVRFYPRQSSVHGFDYRCPKSWDNYYKEYLSFAILYQNEFMREENRAPEMVFECSCDECSSLLNLNCYLYLWLQDTSYKDEARLTCVTLRDCKTVKDDVTLITLGDGAEWKIKRARKSYFRDPEGEENGKIDRWFYTIIPYLNYGAQKAYILEMGEKDLLTLNNAIAEYLDECIKNSESI